MARVSSGSLNLGLWLDGENPGAGSQSVDNTGLNGDKIKIQVAVGTGHNPDGSHKSDVIDGPSLKSTAFDGSSIELAGTPLRGQVKAQGIHKGHIHADVADGDSLQKNGTSGALEIKAVKANKLLGSGTGKAVDGTTIGLNGSGELELKDAAVTATKTAHDNTRTKMLLTFSIDPTTKYGVIGNIVTSATVGVPMPRAGCVTAVSVVDSAGTVATDTAAYSASGANHFAAGAKITVLDDGTGILYVKVNGTSLGDPITGTTALSSLATVEIEFD